jgi:hypothetical protein
MAGLKEIKKIVFINLFVLCSPAFAQEQIDQIKAAFLLNFAKYIEWPQKETGIAGVFKFCVVGPKDHFQDYSLLEKKTLNEKSIVVELIDTADKAASCNVIFFLGGRGSEMSSEILNVTQGKPILTVSDTDEKGMIYLYQSEGRMKFNVNLLHAKESGLNFRSQMLQLASQVIN